MGWDGFESLDLSGVEAETGSARLPNGTYKIRCTKASVEKSGTDGKNRMVVVELVDQAGNGDIRHNFNVSHTSADAQRIALAQLKGFLEVAGHPSPDKPGDIKTLEGLECVIAVGAGKPWTNKKGQTMTSTEVKKFMKADAPAHGPTTPLGDSGKATSSGVYGEPSKRREMDDEIPF
jgi:hypothetical protein